MPSAEIDEAQQIAEQCQLELVALQRSLEDEQGLQTAQRLRAAARKALKQAEDKQKHRGGKGPK